MAFTTTTNSSAIAATDQSIVVASATGMAAGMRITVGDEVMKVRKSYVSGTTVAVLRAQEGSKRQAHAITSNVNYGVASDFAVPVEQGFINESAVVGRGRQVKEYGASGAVTLPTAGNDMLAIFNGTSALTMTVANPTKDMDGCVLTMVGNGIANHNVTFATALGNAGTGYTVLTFDTAGQGSISVIAANAIWIPYPSPLSGTLTKIDMAIS